MTTLWSDVWPAGKGPQPDDVRLHPQSRLRINGKVEREGNPTGTLEDHHERTFVTALPAPAPSRSEELASRAANAAAQEVTPGRRAVAAAFRRPPPGADDRIRQREVLRQQHGYSRSEGSGYRRGGSAVRGDFNNLHERSGTDICPTTRLPTAQGDFPNENGEISVQREPESSSDYHQNNDVQRERRGCRSLVPHAAAGESLPSGRFPMVMVAPKPWILVNRLSHKISSVSRGDGGVGNDSIMRESRRKRASRLALVSFANGSFEGTRHRSVSAKIQWMSKVAAKNEAGFTGVSSAARVNRLRFASRASMAFVRGSNKTRTKQASGFRIRNSRWGELQAAQRVTGLLMHASRFGGGDDDTIDDLESDDDEEVEDSDCSWEGSGQSQNKARAKKRRQRRQRRQRGQSNSTSSSENSSSIWSDTSDASSSDSRSLGNSSDEVRPVVV